MIDEHGASISELGKIRVYNLMGLVPLRGFWIPIPAREHRFRRCSSVEDVPSTDLSGSHCRLNG